MWGCIGIGRSGFWTKVTSGGSISFVSQICLTQMSERCVRFLTDWVLVPKSEHQSVNIWVERVVVENLDVQVPRLEVIGRHKRDARREVVSDLSRQLSQLTRNEPKFGRGGRGGAWLQAGKRPASRRLVRACAKTDTQTVRHTFVNSFPSRLCAKLAPMLKWRRG